MWRLKGVVTRLKSDLGVSRPEHPSDRIERNIRVNIYHGICSILALNMAAPFIGIFAVRLGASEYQVGLLSSGPALVSLLSMIPGGRFMDKRVRKKKPIAVFIMLQRVFYLFIATIPFFVPDRRAHLLVLAVTAMNIPASIANIGWQAFISKVVPAERRAEAFAARNRLMNLAGTIVVLITGRLIDISGFPVGYQIFFTGAFALSLLEIWVLGKVDEATVETGEEGETADNGRAKAVPATGEMDHDGSDASKGLWRRIRVPDSFLRHTLASVFFYLALQAPWPLFTLYQVKVLEANNTWVSLLNLTNTSGSLLGYGFWAKQCMKRGTLGTLVIASAGIFAIPVVYAYSRSLLTIVCFNLFTGAIFSGVNLALFNRLLEITPERSKASYIAYYTTAINVSGIFAPMVGVGLLNLYGFRWAFLTCALMRLSASLFFLIVQRVEKKALLRTQGAAV
ncbi:MAG TPA: MFS transporter [Firmicutes bacterium]|jgi:MFS family permease|nr:MFS transporter [Candidatus Fermentithermobacillaceae bacterium]